MTIAPGSKLGPYAVVREIGRGGMGIVYLARDDRLDRSVAIKALPEHVAADAVRLARFELEAKSLAQLNHPNVAGIYGVEEQDGKKYLILEYVEGDSLADRLDGGPLPIDDALEFAAGIAAGTAAAHEAGVIHRDLKPDNIKLALDGTVKVLDFGLAKSSDTVSSSGSGSESETMPVRQHSPTIPGAIMGTAAYMSPEQARGRSVDKRTDIWSFGVILYEMLVGASPFAGDTAGDSIGAVLHKDLDFDRIPPETPATVRLLLHRCLVRDPRKRLHDIADARLEIEAAIEDPDTASRLFEGGVPAAQRAGRRTPLLVAAAVALLLGGLALGWTLRRAPAPTTSEVVRLSLPLPWRRELVETFDFSPDGTTLAFAVLDPDASPKSWSVYVRRLEADDFEKIHTSARRTQLLWFSPDSADLILGEGGEFERQQFVRLSVDGGRPVPLLEAEPGTYGGGDRCWLSEDEMLLFGEGDERALYAVSARDGAVRRVLEVPAGLGKGFLGTPMVVPGNRHVLFTLWGLNESETTSDIYAYDLRTGTARVLIEGGADCVYYAPDVLIFHLGDEVYVTRFDTDTCETVGRVMPARDDIESFYHADCGHVAYWRRRDGRGTIGMIDRTGKVEPVVDARRWYRGGAPALSPDGARVAVSYWEDASDDRYVLSVIECATGVLQRVDTGILVGPAWMPDGRLAYCRLDDYAGAEGLSGTIMTWDPNARPTTAPLRSDLRVSASDFTIAPDGTYLAFTHRDERDREDLMLLDLTDPESKPRPYLKTPASELAPSFSPNGKWLAYASEDTGAARNVFVTPFDPGEPPRPVRVSIDGGYESFWAPDSSELFFYEPGPLGDTFFSAAVEASPEPQISTPVKIFDTDQYDNSYLAPMPDGERFVFIDSPERRPEDDHFIVVLNWVEELRRSLDEE